MACSYNSNAIGLQGADVCWQIWYFNTRSPSAKRQDSALDINNSVTLESRVEGKLVKGGEINQK